MTLHFLTWLGFEGNAFVRQVEEVVKIHSTTTLTALQDPQYSDATSEVPLFDLDSYTNINLFELPPE